MKIRQSVCTGLLVAFFSTEIVYGSEIDITVPDIQMSPEVTEIHEAASIADPVERESALRSAIERGLLGTDKETQTFVFNYLVRNTRWLDLSPFEYIFRDFDSTQSRHFSLWLLDMNQLLRKSYEDRLSIYRRAILTGEVPLEHGRPLTRYLAINAALKDGMVALGDLIKEQYENLEENYKSRLTSEDISVFLEFRNGGINREMAAKIAAENMSQYDSSKYRARMDYDLAFRRNFEETAKFVCAINPYTNAQNPGCRSIAEIYIRERRHRTDIMISEKSVGIRTENGRSQPPTNDWYESLGSLELSGAKFLELKTIDSGQTDDSGVHQ